MANFSPVDRYPAKAALRFTNTVTGQTKQTTFSDVVNVSVILGDAALDGVTIVPPTITKPDGTQFANIGEWMEALGRALCSLTTCTYDNFIYIPESLNAYRIIEGG